MDGSNNINIKQIHMYRSDCSHASPLQFNAKWPPGQAICHRRELRTEYSSNRPLMQTTDEAHMRAAESAAKWAIKMLRRVCLCAVCSVVGLSVRTNQMMMKWSQCNNYSKSLTEHSKFQSPQSKIDRRMEWMVWWPAARVQDLFRYRSLFFLLLFTYFL